MFKWVYVSLSHEFLHCMSCNGQQQLCFMVACVQLPPPLRKNHLLAAQLKFPSSNSSCLMNKGITLWLFWPVFSYLLLELFFSASFNFHKFKFLLKNQQIGKKGLRFTLNLHLHVVVQIFYPGFQFYYYYFILFIFWVKSIIIHYHT